MSYSQTIVTAALLVLLILSINISQEICVLFSTAFAG